MSNCIRIFLSSRMRVETRADFMMQIRTFLTFLLIMRQQTMIPHMEVQTSVTYHVEVRIEFRQCFVPYIRS